MARKATFKAMMADAWRAQGRSTATYSGLGMGVAMAMAYAASNPTWKSWAFWIAAYAAINVAGMMVACVARRKSS